MVLVDFDEGLFDSLSSASNPLSLLLQFVGRMAHTARMLPVKDGAGPLLAGSASARGARDGLRFEHVANVPLPVLGDVGDIEQEFVLSDLSQGQGANASGQFCAADVPSLLQPGRFLVTNYTVPEDWNRNGAFDAAEIDACSSGALRRRVDNFQSRMFNEIVAQRQFLLASGKERAVKGMAVLSGGPNIGPGQNRSTWLGSAGIPASEGWAELLGRSWPDFVHELTHQLGVGHAPTSSLPGPAYDLFLRRRVRQPFDVMAGGLDPSSTFTNSFLNRADFATAVAGVPQLLPQIASPARQPEDSLLITGSRRGRRVAFSHLRRIVRGYPDGKPPRADLVVRLLDASGIELSRADVALAPLPRSDQHGGPGRPADVTPFATTVRFDARARTVILQDAERRRAGARQRLAQYAHGPCGDAAGRRERRVHELAGRRRRRRSPHLRRIARLLRRARGDCDKRFAGHEPPRAALARARWQRRGPARGGERRVPLGDRHVGRDLDRERAARGGDRHTQRPQRARRAARAPERGCSRRRGRQAGGRYRVALEPLGTPWAGRVGYSAPRRRYAYHHGAGDRPRRCQCIGQRAGDRRALMQTPAEPRKGRRC